MCSNFSLTFFFYIVKNLFKSWVKDQKKRRNYVKAPQLELQLSLDKQALKDQAQSAMTESEVVLFKVVWDEFSKPDKNGKVRRYPQELLLPALHIIRR